MARPQPLAVRKSLTNWNYWFQLIFSFVWIGMAYALYERWPSFATSSVTNDYLLAGLLLIIGIATLIFGTIRPLFDREPLLQMDDSGLRPPGTGAPIIPWRDINDCRFERVSEGRSSNWYLFFTQIDSTTGLKFNHKIPAEEFDGGQDEILARIGRFKSADIARGMQPRIKPDAIRMDAQGDVLIAGYSRQKGWRSIGLYWLAATVAVATAIYIDLESSGNLFLLREFYGEPLLVLSVTNNWPRFFAMAAIAFAAIASVFRLRDLFFREVALRADRTGLTSPEFEGEIIPWTDIPAITFEPTGIMQVTVTAPDPAERFLNIKRFTLSEHEVFDALNWLLARYKIRLHPA